MNFIARERIRYFLGTGAAGCLAGFYQTLGMDLGSRLLVVFQGLALTLLLCLLGGFIGMLVRNTYLVATGRSPDSGDNALDGVPVGALFGTIFGFLFAIIVFSAPQALAGAAWGCLAGAIAGALPGEYASLVLAILAEAESR